MESQINIKEIQRKVYLAYFSDGLWDILLGTFIMLFTVHVIPFPPLTAIVCYMVGYFVVIFLKRRITHPRVGYARISWNRKVPIMLFMPLLVVGIIVLVGGLVAYISVTLGIVFESQYIVMGTLFAAVVAFIAYRFKVKRWYIYALLILVAYVLREWSSLSLRYGTFIFGGIILLVGMVVLVRFLRKYREIIPEQLDEQTQGE